MRSATVRSGGKSERIGGALMARSDIGARVWRRVDETGSIDGTGVGGARESGAAERRDDHAGATELPSDAMEMGPMLSAGAFSETGVSSASSSFSGISGASEL